MKELVDLALLDHLSCVILTEFSSSQDLGLGVRLKHQHQGPQTTSSALQTALLRWFAEGVREAGICWILGLIFYSQEWLWEAKSREGEVGMFWKWLLPTVP